MSDYQRVDVDAYRRDLPDGTRALREYTDAVSTKPKPYGKLSGQQRRKTETSAERRARRQRSMQQPQMLGSVARTLGVIR